MTEGGFHVEYEVFGDMGKRPERGFDLLLIPFDLPQSSLDTTLARYRYDTYSLQHGPWKTVRR